MIETKIEKREPLDQWLAVNRMLHLHRSINYVAGGILGLLVIALVAMAFRSPLVVVLRGQEKQYYQSERRSTSITEEDVAAFVRDFLEQMFNWNSLVPEAISKRIAPLVTQGLADKIRAELVRRSETDFKGKTLSEGITNIEVQVTEKDVVASFDKVLRINGLPLVVPSQMEFNIVRGSPTRWNPVGLYVNGLVEHEGAK